MAVAQQEIQKLATELERHKMRNFSFRNFCPSVNISQNATCGGNSFRVPVNAPKYTITVVDLANNGALNAANATGFAWGISATRINPKEQAKNYDLLMRSDGVRCMTRTTNAVSTHANCGTASENW
ncbi:hypothetical protein L3D26_09765 [Moraxella sp. ZY21109]|nr:hypothetical protein LU301_10065 [Moraxella sp. ZY210820]